MNTQIWIALCYFLEFAIIAKMNLIMSTNTSGVVKLILIKVTIATIYKIKIRYL